MKILLYGATGSIGSRILNEALQRGHSVTAVVRNLSKLEAKKGLTIIQGDILNTDDVAKNAKGNDIVLCSYSPGTGSVALFMESALSLINGLKKSGIKRMIIVGGAGSLYVNGTTQLIDTPEFPEAWKAPANEHCEVLKVFLNEKELDWSYASPAALIEPGERTGKFRWGTDNLVVDASGNSKISMEDFAIALLDEAEHSKHIRKRFTVAY